VDKLRILKHLEAIEGYMALGMTEDALAEANAALADDPGAEPCLRAKASVLMTTKRYAEAEACFRELLSVNPRSVDGWIHLAYCERRTTSLEAAVETLQRALKLDPAHGLANFNMACYRAVQGLHAEALRLLARAVKKDAGFRKLARKETDFDSIRALPEFKELAGES
jgi:tetratricopeptide (TPR) repeat protein